jgi:uncharacterized protein
MAFRILSLDGGGTWALLEAMALQDLFPDRSGHEILRQFDLAVANSGGSIVLAGLVLDMTPAQILGLFEDSKKRQAIFWKKFWLEGFLSRHVPIFPRYAAAKKRIGLGEVMGPRGNISLAFWPRQPGWPTGPSGDRVRLLVVTFDYDRLREEMLRSYDVGNIGASAETISLVDAVHASTNAPVTYFDAPAFVGKRRYWDGAMGAYNNPLMAGVVDAISLGCDPMIIEALSLGAGTVRLLPSDLAQSDTPPDLQEDKVRPSIFTYAKVAAGCITDDPPDAATYTAHIVLRNIPNELGRVVRLSPVIQPVKESGAWTYPSGLSKAAFDALAQLGMDATRDEDVALIEQLGAAWIHGGIPNQAIRVRDDLEPDPGDPTYADGKRRWQAMTGTPPAR